MKDQNTYRSQVARPRSGVFVLFDVTYTCNDTDIKALGHEAFCPSVVHQSVLERVSRSIIALRDGTDDAGKRRENDEKVELGLKEKLMEIPSP